VSTVREQATELLRLLGLDTSIVALDVVGALSEAHLLRSEDTSEDTSTDVLTPRVWRAGDAQPGDDVRAVLDRDGDVWQLGPHHARNWVLHDEPDEVWPDLLVNYGPLVEVMLPEPVLS
jgi:hypothetical protein